MKQRLSCQTHVWRVFQQVFHAEPVSCVPFIKSFSPKPRLRHARVLGEALRVDELRPKHADIVAFAPQHHFETPHGLPNGPAGHRNGPLRIPQHPKILNYRFPFPLGYNVDHSHQGTAERFFFRDIQSQLCIWGKGLALHKPVVDYLGC